MSFNVLEAAKGYITPELISKASSFLGEKDSAAAKAMSGILPAVLSSVVSKASSGHEGANEVFSMAKNTYSSGFLGNLGNLFSDGGGMLDKGLNLVKGLLGNKFNSVLDTISSFAGIKNSSASSLFSIAAPVIAGTLGRHTSNNNLDSSDLVNMLGNQKSSIMSAFPSGLSNIVSMLGLSKLTGGAKDVASDAYKYTENTVRKAGSGMKWLLPLLLTLLAAALIWWFLLGGKNGCSSKQAAVDDTTNVTIENPDTAIIITEPVEPVSLKVKLPDGMELDAYKGGIEEKLVAFLGTEWMKLGEDSLKKLWFDFDNLNFNTGSSEITPASQVQINNIVSILKAFPNAKLKIGGYTDKTGNEATNKKISAERANAVKVALESAGVGGQVLSAEGYGSEFAQYPADAPESDRVKDRHVSVSVRG